MIDRAKLPKISVQEMSCAWNIPQCQSNEFTRMLDDMIDMNSPLELMARGVC